MSDTKQLPATQTKELPAVNSEPGGPGFIPKTMEALMQVAKFCASSGFFDGANTPDKAAVKIMAGAEMGMTPMQAMGSVYVFRGKTGVEGKMIAARIKSSGKYDYKILKSTPEECILQFLEDGEPIKDEDEGIVKYTMDDVRANGWAGNAGYRSEAGKRNMLFYRGITTGMRLYCPHIFSLPVLSVEEIQDEQATIITAETAMKSDKATEALANAGKRQREKRQREKRKEQQQEITDVQVNSAETGAPPKEETTQPEEASPQAPAAESPAESDDDLITPDKWGKLMQMGQPNGWNSLDIQKFCCAKFNLPADAGQAITNKQSRQVAAAITKVTPEKAGVR